MSYARFSETCDVYVYMDVNGTLACCGCILGKMPWYYDSTQAMVDHLAEHRAAGHDVPDIEPELWADDEENFPPQCAGGHDWGEPYVPYPDWQWLKRVDCRRCGWTDDVHDELPQPAPVGDPLRVPSPARDAGTTAPAGATQTDNGTRSLA